MNIYQIIVTAIIVGAVCGAVGFLFPYLKKKGIDAPNAIKGLETGLQEVGTFIQEGEQILGNKTSKATAILDLIDKLGIKCIKETQQLAISSQLPLDQRREKAKESILNGLVAFKITVTPELDKLIDSTIQEMVFDSKTPEEQRSQATNTLAQQNQDLNQQIIQLTAQKTDLQNQVIQLQQQLQTIQSNLQIVQNASIGTTQTTIPIASQPTQ